MNDPAPGSDVEERPGSNASSDVSSSDRNISSSDIDGNFDLSLSDLSDHIVRNSPSLPSTTSPDCTCSPRSPLSGFSLTPTLPDTDDDYDPDEHGSVVSWTPSPQKLPSTPKKIPEKSGASDH